MKVTELRDVLDDTLLTLQASRDELRDLDAAIGDGDLGITVTEGARAVRDSLGELPAEATVADLLRHVAKGFARANPSTMSALVAGALLAASRDLEGVLDLGRDECLVLLTRASESIQKRGGAEPGDKTVLDALLASLDALDTSGQPATPAVEAMADATRKAVEQLRATQSRRGRAAWVGERSVGHADGGMTAYLRLLEGLHRAMTSRPS